MKILKNTTAIAAFIAVPALSYAGPDTMVTVVEEPDTMVTVVEEPAVGSAISGWISLDLNTHFISYGADVWGAGDNWNDALFNPSMELAWAINDDVSFLVGTWWDVNDNAVSDIGGDVQEVDVWAGFSFPLGPVDATLLYQAWMYGEKTEQIIDLILGYDTTLAPSLVIHGRVEEGASGGDTGVVVVPGVDLFAFGDGVGFGEVSLSAPLNVAFASDGFHGGDSGFAYISAGLSASIPLSAISVAYGEWDLHAGLTYYYTDDSVIPNNPSDSFLTGSIGIGVAF